MAYDWRVANVERAPRVDGLEQIWNAICREGVYEGLLKRERLSLVGVDAAGSSKYRSA